MVRVGFRGHPLISALHPTTIEITTENHLTRKGDCIVGVGAEKGCAILDEGVKEMMRRNSTVVTFRLVVENESFVIRAKGDPRLTLAHASDMVIRKSDFISDRTVGIGADAAAKDIPRSIVAKLRDPGAVGYLEIEVS